MKCFTSSLGVVSIVVSLGCVHFCYAQSFTVQSGNWSSPSVWSGGIVPDASTGSITVLHDVAIPADTSLVVDELTLNATLTISAGASFIVRHKSRSTSDLLISSGRINVFGRLVCQDSALIVGSSITNTFFEDGSTYEHQYFNAAGSPPIATWNKNSTLALTGFRSSRSLNSTAWSQAFGNVLYDCANQQASSFVEMLGNLNVIQGNFTIRNTNGGVLRVTLDRTALNTISIGGNFLIEGNSEVWLSRAANTLVMVGGNFEYRSTATPSSYLTTTGTCELRVLGNVLINSNGILRFASSGGGHGTLSTIRNFDIVRGTLAVLPVGDGKILLNGNTPQTFSSLSTIANGIDIEINNPSGVTIPSALASGGGLVLRSGSLLQLPNLNVSFGGNINSESGVTILANNGRLILNGSSDQTMNLAGNILNQLNINKPGGTVVTLTGSLRLRDRLTLESPNTVFRSNGNLTLLSTSDDGLHDAAVSELPPGSSVQGNVTVQRYMSGEGRIYRYISSPVQNATIDSLQDDFPITGTFNDPSTGPGLAANNPSFFYYDETLEGTQGWIAYPSGGMAHDHELKAGVGYAAFIRQALLATRWDVTGAINQGSINLPVTYHNSNDSENDGWNLVGNPYASPIDWNRTGGWTKTNILPGIAVRDNGNRRFLYWDGEVGNLGNGRIAAGQAFWVRSSADDPALTIREFAKSTTQAPFYRTDASADFVELSLDGNIGKDQAYLRLREGAKNDVDNFDIVKFPNDVVNLSFLVDSMRLAIHAIERVGCGLDLPVSLNFQQLSNGSWVQSPLGTYALSASTFGLFNPSSLVLFDKLLSVEHDLALPYVFEIKNDYEAKFPDRFSIRFNVPALSPIKIVCDSIVCSSDFYSIDLSNLQSGVRYSILVNGMEASSFINRESNEHEVGLEPNLFTWDKNRIEVKSESICESRVDTLWITRIKKPEIIETPNGLVSTITTHLEWFDDESTQPVSTEAMFTPTHSGEYRLIVRGKTCEESTSYHYYHQDKFLQVFPVPVTSELNVVAPQHELLLKLSVNNLLTNEILHIDTVHPEKTFRLSMQKFTPGVYLLSVVTDHALYRRKIIVE